MANEILLIVGSEPDHLHQTRESLSQRGYRVLTSVSASAARQTAREEHPDAIVIHVDMPVAEAHEVCRLLKSDNRLEHIPVIFIQDKPSTDDKVAGFGAGAHDYIVWPCQNDELAARIGAAARVKRAQDRLMHKNARLETLAKHVLAAVQHFERPRFGGDGVPHGQADGDGKAAVRLTRRELEILQMLAKGLSNEAISRQLYISPTTARNHIQNILGKLGVHSKLEAVAYAVRAGYVDFVG